MTRRFSLPLPGDHTLASSVGFLEGFTPQRVEVRSDDAEVELRFAACFPPGWKPTEIVLRESARRIEGEVAGGLEPDAARQHVERMLSLDIDDAGLADVSARDPIAARVIDRAACRRPPLFWTPYEAAAWSVISQRNSMQRATGVKSRLTSDRGTTVGSSIAFPDPDTLLSVCEFNGLSATQIGRLHAVARAALSGTLDVDMLRSQSPDEALALLQEVNGIGPFTAELILVRGAGTTDVFPRHENRLHGIMRDAYDRPDATVKELGVIADAWRPFRSWVSFYFRASGA